MGEEIISLEDLHQDKANARRHNPRNVGTIVDALHEVGAARSGVIDEDGRILAGNATWEALAEAGIKRVKVVDADGEEWVVVRRSGLTERQKKRLALFDNRTAELADWDTDVLAELRENEADVLDGLFYDGELDELLAGLDSVPDEDDNYSRKIESPVYEPSGDCPDLASLYDDTRTRELIAKIESAEGISDGDKEFLRVAAQRHTVLRFERIADYYAHADAETQALMEDSALVIIDFEKAIELGYVRLAEAIAEQYKADYGDS